MTLPPELDRRFKDLEDRVRQLENWQDYSIETARRAVKRMHDLDEKIRERQKIRNADDEYFKHERELDEKYGSS